VNYKKVFVDANIILDLFLDERPHSEYSKEAFFYLYQKNVELLTSCDLITTVYYVLRKYNKQKALENLSYTLDLLYLIPFSNAETKKAIKLMEKDKNFKDLEDTLQYVLAKENECDLILSNDNNFYSPDIKIINTKELSEKIK
jgi:predicted nucleic acid-binding protein